MFINLDEIDALPLEKLDKLYQKHYNRGLYKLFKLANISIHFTKAEGMYLFSSNGTPYLDFTANFGALNLGHNPHNIIEALKDNFDKPNLAQFSINKYNAVLANNISCLTNHKLPICHFTSSGTETVEEALKLAYMNKKNGAIVYCSKAYHGKTMGSISALGDKAKENYLYFDKSFIEVPFGDIKALEKIGKKNDIAAFLVEPIQGEGGIITPPNGYFEEVREYCNKHNIILIFDEIQTGLGRCGSMFCYTQYNIVPDIICLSKSLSGGIIPIGCIAVEETLWNETYGKLKNATLPSTTFGGNTFASIAAIKTLELLLSENLPSKSYELGKYTISKLKELKEKHISIITDIRGVGLFIGVEFGGLKHLPSKIIKEFMISAIISKMLRKYKILCGFTSNSPEVLRIEPPLIVTKEQIDLFIKSLDEVLTEYKNEFSLAIGTIKNAGKVLIKQ